MTKATPSIGRTLSLFTRSCVAAGLFLGAVAYAQRPAVIPGSDTSAHDLEWGRARKAAALEMVARLDVTSFANSTGPRRVEGKRTLAQYGFTKVTGFDDGWAYAAQPDGSWQFGVFVLDDHRRHKRLCVTDAAVGGGTYHSTVALDVTPRGDGLWHVADVAGAIAGCS